MGSSVQGWLGDHCSAITKMRTIVKVVMLWMTTAINASAAQFWRLPTDAGFRKNLLGEHQLGLRLGGLEPGAGIDAGLGLYGVPVHVSGVSTPARNFGFQVEGQLGSLGAGTSAGIQSGFLGLSSLFGFGKKKYTNQYQQFQYTPYRGPWFRPRNGYIG